MATSNSPTPNTSSSSVSQFIWSPEHRTMMECNVLLVDLLKTSISSLGDALFARGLIPPDVKDTLQLNSVSPANKAREVIGCLTDRIKHHPSVYHEFVKTLGEQGPYTESCMNDLITCYTELQTTIKEVSLKKNDSQSKLQLELTVPQDCLEEVIRAIESVQVRVIHTDQDNQSMKTIPLIAEKDNSTAAVPESSAKVTQTKWGDNPGFAHGATGGRDVLFLVSNTPTNNPDIVSRRSNRLTEEEREKLEEQGVHRDCHYDDLSIMNARYGLDKEIAIAGVMSGELTCEGVKRRIIHHMNSTDKPGVVLHYIGHGKRGTGDWCFSDGFITFRELMDLYMSNQYFRGRVFTIVSDCSYSGSWVREATVFMDEHGVGPCGHVAKEKGILVKVFTSCLSNEIPAELAFSTHSAKNDKNIDFARCKMGTLRGDEIHNRQHPSRLDFTQVRCKNKIDQPCTMAPGSTWQKWSASKRIYIVKDEHKGRPTWCFILLVDDDESIRTFEEKTQRDNSGKATYKLSNYGQVLERGWGLEPPKGTLERIKESHCVNYNYKPT